MEDKKNLNPQFLTIAKKYDLFIFDFDGTVTEPLTVDWQVLKRKLHKMLNKPYDKKNTMDSLLYGIRKNLKGLGTEKAYELVKDYEKKSVGNARLNRNFQELMSELPNKKKKAIFSTNMKDTITNILARNNLSDFFDCIISKEDVTKYKPNPEGLLSILHYFKIPARKAIYIGDSKIDLISGSRAKIKTVLIN